MRVIPKCEDIVKSHKPYTARTRDVLRRGALWIGLGAMVGCAPVAPQDQQIALRNPAVPLGGTTRFEMGRFSGDWVTVACLGRCVAASHYRIGEDGTFVRRAAGRQVAYRAAGPGVLRAVGDDARLVIMWVDDGFRTAAIGDADGTWAAVIDRRKIASRDRKRAALEILDFNGWDVAKLRGGK